MRVSFAIMALRERDSNVEKMRAHIGGQVPVSYDDKREGPWSNWKNAWAMKHPRATHHCVLQDDLLLCDEFRAHVAKLAKELPECAICGFVPRIIEPPRPGRNWCPVFDHVWTQCLVLPVAVGDAAIPWIATHEPGDAARRGRSWKFDDDRLTSYLRHAKVRVCMAVPCIVQHGLYESILGNPPHKATSWTGQA